MNRPSPVVRLRVPTDEDAIAWHRIFDDPDVMEFHGGKPAELSVYEELTARQRRHDAEYGFCFWSMLDEQDDVIGFTGAQPMRGMRPSRRRTARPGTSPSPAMPPSSSDSSSASWSARCRGAHGSWA